MTNSVRLAVLLLALQTVCAATAADDPIAQRKLIMLQNAKAESVANSVILGKYFANKASASMKKLEDNLTVFSTLFPEGSDKGDANASPAIWKNMDDFKSLAEKLVSDAKTAEAAAADGQDAFTLAFQAVEKDCQSCHEKYSPAT